MKKSRKTLRVVKERFGRVPRTANPVMAFNTLFEQSTSVTCDGCGRELKTESNRPRLMRLGCPACGNRRFTYHGLPEEKATVLLNEIPGIRQNERRN